MNSIGQKLVRYIENNYSRYFDSACVSDCPEHNVATQLQFYFILKLKIILIKKNYLLLYDTI